MRIPFGKYKGKDIEEVPASYLLWLHERDWIVKFADIHEHISKNFDLLMREAAEERAAWRDERRIR